MYLAYRVRRWHKSAEAAKPAPKEKGALEGGSASAALGTPHAAAADDVDEPRDDEYERCLEELRTARESRARNMRV